MDSSETPKGNSDSRVAVTKPDEIVQTFKTPEPQKSFGEIYAEKAQKENNRRQTEAHKKRLIAEMQETGELLEKDHPMYEVMEDILNTLKPDEKCDLVLSLSDDLKAFTLVDGKTIVISYGLIKKFQDFVKDRGKNLSKDHLALLLGNQITKGQVALILAHELSHWDKEAEAFHFNETYCDTNGLMMMGKHYNTDDAIDSLEFLEWIEDKEEKPDEAINPEEDEKHKHRISITHPSSENRRTLGLSIVNDPNIHIDGRYIESEAIPAETALDFMRRGEKWVDATKSRWTVGSEQEIQVEYGKAKSASQVLEVFLSSDDYYHAQLSRKISQSKEFGNLILAMATYCDHVQYKNAQPTDMSHFLANYGFLLEKDDFYTQYRASLLKDDPFGNIVPVAKQESEVSFTTHTATQVDKIQLINKILNSEFDNPWEILTLDSNILAQKYPEFAGTNFDNFYKAIVHRVNQFVSPISDMEHNKRGKPNYSRSTFLGFNGMLEMKDYELGSQAENPGNVVINRKKMLDQVGSGLASSMVRYSMDGMKDFQALYDFSSAVNILVAKYSKFVPDYTQMKSKVEKALINADLCQTEDVAHDISVLFTASGRYASDSGFLVGRWDANAMDYRAIDSDDELVQKDIRNSIFSKNFAISQGGVEIGRAFGMPHISGFIEGIEGYYDMLVGDQDQLLHHEYLDPYDIFVSGNPTFQVSFSEPLLGYVWSSINLDGKLFKKEEKQTQRNKIDRPMCQTTDSRTLIHLISDTISGHDKAIAAIIDNPDLSGNSETMRLLISAGIEKYSLVPLQIRIMLDASGDLNLYREFLPYLSTVPLEQFQKRWFHEFSQLPENSGLKRPELVAKFIENGGIVSVSWDEATDDLILGSRGAKLIPHELGKAKVAGRAFEEDPEYGLEDAKQAADRIIAYVHGSNFKDSEINKRALLNTAACLTRYSEGLYYNSAGYSPSLRLWGKDIVSVEQLVSKLSLMPESDYKDDFLYLAATMRPGSGEFQRDILDDTSLKKIMGMFSPVYLRQWDMDNKDVILVSTHPVESIPILAGSHDVSEHFTFYHSDNERFIDVVTYYAEMLDKEFTQKGITSIKDKLGEAVKAVPYRCGVRDYLVERVLFPIMRNGEYGEMSQGEKLDLLRSAFASTITPRTRGALASEIVRLRLNELGVNVDFNTGLGIILETMEYPSSERDHFINDLLNSTYTTWDQIDHAQSLILGHSYRTDVEASTARSGISEAVSYGIERMETDERVELITFLLDVNKHVVQAKDLTPAFFDEGVKRKLRSRLREIYISNYGDNTVKDFEHELDQNYDQVEHYLIQRYKSSIPQTDESPISEELKEFSDLITFPELLRMATPDSLNKLLQEQFAGNDRDISATSLGSMFLRQNPSDRRQLIYRLCLGDNGFFEDRRFDNHGHVVVESLIDIATKMHTKNLSEGQVEQKWSEAEISTMKQVVVSTFQALPPARRTELLARTLNLIADTGGQVSKEQLIEVGLTAFDVVGAKIGQMDVLIPEDLRQTLASLKENVPSIPKPTMANLLKRQGRRDKYKGLGKTKGGSTASIAFARSLNSDREDKVIKMIRPDVLKNVDGSIQAATAAITSLVIIQFFPRFR